VFPEESTAVTVTLTDAPEVEAVGALTVRATLCANAAGPNNAAAIATAASLAMVTKRTRMGFVVQQDTDSIAPESPIQSIGRAAVLLRLFA
jgi:hypothetical protein